MNETTPVSDGYSNSADAWRRGPARIYDRLAIALVERIEPVRGKTALDVGAGTGAASAALMLAGARVVAVDVAPGMLEYERSKRPPCVVADAVALPFRDGAFEIVVAAFSLNHLTQPALGLREAARVTRRGGIVVASAYAADDDHPAKQAAHSVAAEFGWRPATWWRRLREDAMPKLATVERAVRETLAAGISATVEPRQVRFPELDAPSLIEWRLGMADLAPFVASLAPAARVELLSRAVEQMGSDYPMLVRRMIVITAAV